MTTQKQYLAQARFKPASMWNMSISITIMNIRNMMKQIVGFFTNWKSCKLINGIAEATDTRSILSYWAISQLSWLHWWDILLFINHFYSLKYQSLVAIVSTWLCNNSISQHFSTDEGQNWTKLFSVSDLTVVMILSFSILFSTISISTMYYI